MLASIDDALAELYPTRTWGEPIDRVVGPLSDDIAALADELATELRAATFVRPGGDDEPCDYVYVLCVGRTPCIAQVRDHGVAPPTEWADVATVHELYLRVVVSQRAPVAAVQQVALEVTPIGRAGRAGRAGERFVVREQPRAGVYDPPLLPRLQRLVAILPTYQLLHVDFGEIAHPPPGFLPGAWHELFGGQPAIANYLFYPQPTTMISTTLVGGRVASDGSLGAR